MFRGRFLCCLYLCHMKYIHPDIVVGEPVPEVEPRVNVEMLGAIGKLNRWGIWFVGVYGVIVLGVVVARPAVWVSYVVFFIGVFAWAIPFFRLKKALREYKTDQWCIPFRDGLKYRLVSTCVGFVLYMPVLATGRVSSTITILGLMVVGGGVVLFFMLRQASEPGQVGCVDCGYPLLGLTLPCECPECGRMIYDATWTTDRVRVRSPWFVWGGMGLIVLGSLIAYGSFARPGVFYGTMPRGVLMNLAVSDRGAFDELIAKPISEKEEAELIEAIIARNDGSGDWDYQSSKQGRWVMQFVGTGKISWEQFDRMFGRVVGPIRIEVSGAKRVGEPIEVRLASEYVSIPGSGDSVRYFFRGFEVGDDSELSGGGSKERYLGFLDSEFSQASYKYVPRVTLTPSEAGELVVRARVIVALLPAQWTTHVRWGDGDFERFFDKDGKSGAGIEPLWSEQIDLEYVIEVER